MEEEDRDEREEGLGFRDFFRIDKSMRESRTTQVIGAILLVALIIFGILYKYYS